MVINTLNKKEFAKARIDDAIPGVCKHHQWFGLIFINIAFFVT